MLTDNIKLSASLAILSILLYANTLQNGYVIDDGQVITNNKLVTQGIKAIPELLTSTRLKGYGNVTNESYRPLSLVTFAIEYQFCGDTPVSGHLFNILYFAACVVLLFLLLHRLFNNHKLAFISALIFAVHPIHTEVVANIKSRDELLCFLFACWSLITFCRYQRGGNIRHLVGGLALFLLSLLAKETAISFVAVIPLVFFFYLKEERKRSIHILIASLAAASTFLLMRYAILYGHAATEIVFMSNPLVAAPDFATRIATAIMGLGLYLRLLFIPYPLICDYSYKTIPFVGFSNIYVLLSLCAYIAMGAIAIYRVTKKTNDPWAFGISYFMITIALFSNIPFLVYSQFAERFLFLPSAGFCLIAALAIENALQRKQQYPSIAALWRPAALAILLPITGILSFLTFNRNADWKDNLTLFSADIQKAPENGWLCFGLGNKLISTTLDAEKDPATRRQIIDDAIQYLSTAVSVLPDHVNANSQLSYAYVKRQMPDSAKKYALKALQLAPESVQALTTLGALYHSTREFPKAVQCFKQALAIKPDYVIEYSNIGISYLYMEQFDSAIHYLQQSLVHVPKNKMPYGHIALAYYGKGQRDSALKYQQIIQQYYPSFKLPE